MSFIEVFLTFRMNAGIIHSNWSGPPQPLTIHGHLTNTFEALELTYRW